MPAVLNCRGDSGCAAWKNHGLGCEYVAPFPVFSEIFWDFLPFWKGIPVGISQRGEEKGCQIYFFRLPIGMKMVISGKFMSFG